jgi:hypothetical protein
MYFVAVKMGRRQGARSGAYLNRTPNPELPNPEPRTMTAFVENEHDETKLRILR